MTGTEKKKGSAGQNFLNWCRSGIVHFLDYITPKNDRMIIFGSSNGRQFYGDPKVIYEHVVKNCSKDFDAYYYLENGPADDPHCLIKGGAFNWATIGKVVKARTLVGSHGLQDFGPWGFTGRRIFIFTVHGFPFKATALISKVTPKKVRKDWRRIGMLATAILAASDYQAELVAKGFECDKKKLLVVGQAKNDKLVKKDIGTRPEFLDKIPEHRKLIFYCPTFREWEPTRLFPFEDFDKAALEEFLEKNGIVILLRYHINEEAGAKKVMGGRCVDFSYDKFPDAQNEDVLLHADALITDYSSIFLDYLLLDKPIIFLPYDLKVYEKKRGLMVDDYDKWSPGPKPDTFESFLKALQDVAEGNDEFRSERARVNGLVNTAQTANTPEKVVRFIKEWMTGR